MRANKNGVNKDQKDKVKKDGYNRGQHCVYCLTYHIMTEHMSKRSSRVFRYMHDYTPFRQSPMALFATLQCST